MKPVCEDILCPARLKGDQEKVKEVLSRLKGRLSLRARLGRTTLRPTVHALVHRKG